MSTLRGYTVLHWDTEKCLHIEVLHFRVSILRGSTVLHWDTGNWLCLRHPHFKVWTLGKCFKRLIARARAGENTAIPYKKLSPGWKPNPLASSIEQQQWLTHWQAPDKIATRTIAHQQHQKRSPWSTELSTGTYFPQHNAKHTIAWTLSF